MNNGTIGGDTDGGFSNSGIFTMNGGLIDGGYSTPSWARSDNATVTMNDGEIIGNAHYEKIRNPFTIKGGTIRGNVSGGNLSGYIIINGGSIYGNVQMSQITLDNGEIIGRVIVYGHSDRSEFIMNGGVVRDSDGDGVSIGRSSLAVSITMNGGTISGHSGRGVSINAAGANFTMNNGTISNNSDGGVFVESGWQDAIFTMNGGSISNNTTSNNGGGVETAGIFVMKGGTIHDNTAVDSGGGVNQVGGTFTFDGGWVFDNSAGKGDDIQIGQTGTFNNNVLDPNIGAIGGSPP
jgi:hypothetical protein